MIVSRVMTLLVASILAVMVSGVSMASSVQTDSAPATVVSTDLLSAPVENLPSPAVITISTMTLPRASTTLPITSPGTVLIHVEAGVLTVVDSGRASGVGPYASGDQLISTFDAGQQIVIPTGARVSLRNAGLETVMLLVAAVLPKDAAA